MSRVDVRADVDGTSGTDGAGGVGGFDAADGADGAGGAAERARRAEANCPSAEDLALLGRWNQLQGAFRRLNSRLLDDVENSSGVSPSAFQVLWFLVGSADHTAKMSQLSAVLGFSTAGTTKVADRLAEAGLIERSPSTADRRVILVTLTTHGLEVAGDAIGTFLGALRERALGPLGEDGFAALVAAVAGLDPEGPGGRAPSGLSTDVEP